MVTKEDLQTFIDRLEAGNDKRALVMLGNEAVRRCTDHHADMPRPDEPVDLHVGRVEHRFDCRNDRDVVAEQ